MHGNPFLQGRKRNIFRGGKVIFSWLFSLCEMLFPGRKFPNSHFGGPKTNFSGFEKWEEQKKKKKSSPHFVIFPPSISIFHLPFFNLHSFCSIFSFFLASLFPVGQQKFPDQKSLGGTLPFCPPVMPLPFTWGQKFSDTSVSLWKMGKKSKFHFL